ncbi:MAG TPA: hypothetical protein VFK13_03510 [Gemmatimonadaceae bacterium]|nr:hypothetical protein [Gemmatimonadaceae bacterium]
MDIGAHDEDGHVDGREPVPVHASSPARRAGWLRRRARNAYRLPTRLGVAVATMFLVALAGLVIVPRGARTAARSLRPGNVALPDTLSLVVSETQAVQYADSIASVRDSARRAFARWLQPPAPVDTLSPESRVRRDSIQRARDALRALIQQAKSAPLPASYRALGESPQLRDRPETQQLLDSLAEIEKNRDVFGAVGGVDPIFVALTTRATEIGKTLQQMAESVSVRMDSELRALAPVIPRRSATPPPFDTVALAAAHDSAVERTMRVRSQLARARFAHQEVAARAARARDVAAIGTSPVAVVLAAVVLGAAAGFATLLVGELRRPRIADGREAASVARVPVLTTVREHTPDPERMRRRADREIAAVIDRSSDTYTLLYSQLADAAFNLPILTVIGEESAVTAVVAVNLAAAVACHARTALLVDTDFATRSVARATGMDEGPGLAELGAGAMAWPELVRPVLVGRARNIGVVPSGVTDDPDVCRQALDVLERTMPALQRHYDSVIINAPVPVTGDVPPSACAGRDVIICVRCARTSLAWLEQLVGALDVRGARTRGLVVWDMKVPTFTPPATAGLVEAGA